MSISAAGRLLSAVSQLSQIVLTSLRMFVSICLLDSGNVGCGLENLRNFFPLELDLQMLHAFLYYYYYYYYYYFPLLHCLTKAYLGNPDSIRDGAEDKNVLPRIYATTNQALPWLP